MPGSPTGGPDGGSMPKSAASRRSRIDPDHADTLHLMGLLSLDAGQYDHAIAWLSRAIRQDPKPAYLASLGSALHRQGRLEDALKAYDKAVQLKPDDANLWRDLGNLLFDLKRPDDALLSFQHVLTLDPKHWDAAYRCGYLLNQLGRPEQALPYLDIGHRLQPKNAAMLEMRAIALHSLKRYEEALAENKRAYALNRGQCRNLQQHRRRAAISRPRRGGAAVVRPRAQAAPRLHHGPDQQGFIATAIAPLRGSHGRLRRASRRSIPATRTRTGTCR